MNKYPIPRLLPSSYCDQCGREGQPTVLVGEKENYDTRTASVCQRCLMEAASLFPPNAAKLGIKVNE